MDLIKVQDSTNYRVLFLLKMWKAVDLIDDFLLKLDTVGYYLSYMYICAYTCINTMYVCIYIYIIIIIISYYYYFSFFLILVISIINVIIIMFIIITTIIIYVCISSTFGLLSHELLFFRHFSSSKHPTQGRPRAQVVVGISQHPEAQGSGVPEVHDQKGGWNLPRHFFSPKVHWHVPLPQDSGIKLFSSVARDFRDEMPHSVSVISLSI